MTTNEKKLLNEMYGDFKRFPLPICFDKSEERKELNIRHQRINAIVSRFLKIKNHDN